MARKAKATKGRAPERAPVYAVTVGGKTRYRNKETGRWAPPPPEARPKAVTVTEKTRKAPKVARERTKDGRTIHRGKGGKFVKTPKRKGTPVAIGKGDKRRYIYPVEADKSRPEGAEGLSMQVWGQSMPKTVERNAAEGGDTYVRWRGDIYRITPKDAGSLAHLLRLGTTLYWDAFTGLVGSPMLTYELIETAEGDLIDLDGMQFLSEAMQELMEGEEEIEQAADTFFSSFAAEIDATLNPDR